MQPLPATTARTMVDSFGRRITYVRISVTDRCDLRCRYCMAETMRFLPRQEILTLEEIAALADIFIARGVTRIRLTGGEPLVRRGIADLAGRLGARIGRGLDELTLTTNGTQLAGLNEDEIEEMLLWCSGEGLDLTLIETMPLGDIDGDRTDQYLPLSLVRARLAEEFTLEELDYRSGGPARYVRIKETGGRLGFITPLTHNFCESCNRVRVTCTGTLFMCLGQEDAADLRGPLRASEGNELLSRAIEEAISRKPKGHDFVIDRRSSRPALARHMSVTGG